MNPRDAWIFRRLLVGLPLDGAEPPASGPFAAIAGQLAGLPADDRQPAWEDFIDDLPNGAEINETVGKVNHLSAAPEAPTQDDDDEAPET